MSNSRKRKQNPDFYTLGGTGEIVRGNMCVFVCMSVSVSIPRDLIYRGISLCERASV